MPRYIDADALENEVHTFCREFIVSCRDFRTKCALYDAMKGVLVRIYDAPTLSPDEVRGVGEWIEHHADYKCTACGETVKDEIFYMLDPYRLPTYCPNCGARMKGAEDGTTDNA